ncbi:hypothetical protein JHL22_01285 [Advenella sp. WQ 585]|uniref:Uncharacterized protein n=1 Tax=Advenella mandrilli TaxID=2800330 RepID=A0ABS1E916_9BURK|nr:hypothetical protein [Advenella mandrilli]MBK1779841.1 hypothetical protein [Advenella mandrilli]
MNYSVLTALGLSLCISDIAMAQKTATVIIPPPTHFNAIPTAQSQNEQPSPLWVVAQDEAPANDKLSTLEEVLYVTGETASDEPVQQSIKIAENYALNNQMKLDKIHKDNTKEFNKLNKSIQTKSRKASGYVTSKKTQTKLGNLNKKAELSGKQQSQAAAKTNFLSKLGKVLNALDVVSVAAETTGYLSTGDTTGAAGALVRGGVKKGAEAGGALAGSFIPGGSIAGAWAGGQAYTEYVEPRINEIEDAVRDEQTRQKYINKPWYTPQPYMDSNGNIKYFAENEYMDKKTGTIHTRTPEEQKEYEHQQRVNWNNQNTLQKLIEDYKDGKISDKELLDLFENYDRHDGDTIWNPEADTEQQDNTGNLIAQITPVQVTAFTTITETIGEIEVSTTLTFSFWNVGAYSPPHSKASLSVYSSHPSMENFVWNGTFSGGPNGTLSIHSDDGIITFQLNNGTHLTGEDMSIPISNPAAFANWPKDLR